MKLPIFSVTPDTLNDNDAPLPLSDHSTASESPEQMSSATKSKRKKKTTERVRWTSQETSKANSSLKHLNISSPFGFMATSHISETDEEDSSEGANDDEHDRTDMDAMFGLLTTPTSDCSESEGITYCHDDPMNKAVDDPMNERSLVSENAGGVGLGLGLKITGLSIARTAVINPYEVEVDATLGDCASFVPERVSFSVEGPGDVVINQYEAFDWEAFDEDEVYGSLPGFDYVADMCLDRSDDDLEFNVIVNRTATLKSILRISLSALPVPGTVKARGAEGPASPYLRTFDRNHTFRSPVPTSSSGLVSQVTNQDQNIKTPRVEGTGLSLSFF